MSSLVPKPQITEAWYLGLRIWSPIWSEMHVPSFSHTFCPKYVPPLCMLENTFIIIYFHVQAVRTRMVGEFTWTPKKFRSQTPGFPIKQSIYPQWPFYPTLIWRRKRKSRRKPHQGFPQPISPSRFSPNFPDGIPHGKPPMAGKSPRCWPVFGKAFPAPASPWTTVHGAAATWSAPGATRGKPWENGRKTLENPWENTKTMGTWWENKIKQGEPT